MSLIHTQCFDGGEGRDSTVSPRPKSVGSSTSCAVAARPAQPVAKQPRSVTATFRCRRVLWNFIGDRLISALSMRSMRDVENLNGRIFPQPIDIEFNSDAGILHASERRQRVQAAVLIDPCCA